MRRAVLERAPPDGMAFHLPAFERLRVNAHRQQVSHEVPVARDLLQRDFGRVVLLQ